MLCYAFETVDSVFGDDANDFSGEIVNPRCLFENVFDVERNLNVNKNYS